MHKPLSAPNLQDLPWRCETGDIGRQTTTWQDCQSLAEEISHLARPRQKLIFSTEDPTQVPEVNYQVPITFIHGSCSATIGPVARAYVSRDTFYARYLSRTILEMAQMCVIPAPHKGGMGEIGERKTLGLALLGPRRIPQGTGLHLNSNGTASQ